MQARQLFALALTGSMIFAAGCRSTNSVDKLTFKSTINTYLTPHQQCVWSDPQKFPTQADNSSDEQTKGYDALTDAGFLVRSAVEKKRFLIGSKLVNNYDLSSKGRSTWTADPSQPGYGNFCYGHREVTTVDNFTPPDATDATQYVVNYHYAVANAPAWATALEMTTAFPKIATETSGQSTGTATLVKSSSGWQVTNLTPADTRPILPQ